MKKKMIAILYVTGLLIELLATMSLLNSIGDYNHWMKVEADTLAFFQQNGSTPSPDQLYTQNIAAAQSGIIGSLVVIVLGGAISMVGWIGVLVNLARAQLWAWFVFLWVHHGPRLPFCRS